MYRNQAMFISDVPQSEGAPLVSVLMVARNADEFIHSALLSARTQTFQNIEILVVDDGSTDETGRIAAMHAAADPRVRVIAGPQQGLAAVRNFSLTAARGQWAIILDSDDFLHPRHIEILHRAALSTGAQIVAANMISFMHDSARAVSLFASGREWQQEKWITRAQFIQAGQLNSSGVQLGYLKPLFNLSFLRSNEISYNPSLRIGEDYDLVSRALAAGATYFFSPRPTYFYRRHAGSTSYRLSRSDLTSLLMASELAEEEDDDDMHIRDVATRRRRSLEVALAHLDAIEALKRARLLNALGHLVRRPAAISLLWRSIAEGLSRRSRSLISASFPTPHSDRPTVLLIGDPPEDSAIVCAARALSESGYTVHQRIVTGWDDAPQLASGLSEPDILLLGDDFSCEAAPFAIAPQAAWIAQTGINHPRIDLHVGPAPHDSLDASKIAGLKSLVKLEATKLAGLEGAR